MKHRPYDVCKTKEIICALFALAQKDMKPVYRNGLFAYMRNLFKLVLSRASANRDLELLSRLLSSRGNNRALHREV